MISVRGPVEIAPTRGTYRIEEITGEFRLEEGSWVPLRPERDATGMAIEGAQRMTLTFIVPTVVPGGARTVEANVRVKLADGSSKRMKRTLPIEET